MVKSIYIILDYGHGKNCPGKCSPDKTFYEWKFNRECGMAIARQLRALGYTVYETWTQDHEPLSAPNRVCTKRELNAALNWRARKVNDYCAQFGTQNCISVSIHSNAAGGDGQWHNATGFCVMVGRKASEKSKRLARLIYDEADKRGLRGNRSVPQTHYWVQGLAMCDSTNCPAVLVEAMFYDNRSDLAILQSSDGREKIVSSVVDGITQYAKTL